MASDNEQGVVWNQAARDWEEMYESQRSPLNDGILDACGVTSGTYILDAGCGSGGLSLRASLRGARVAGFDISEEMVERSRAKVADGDFQLGELNAPPYDDDTFDAVISSECLFFSPDPVAAIRELGRVCKEQGKIAIAVLGGPEISDLSRMFSSIHAILPEPPRVSPLALSSDGKLEDLIAKAGLKLDDARAVPCTYNFDKFDTFWGMARNFGGIKSMIGAMGEEKILTAALAGAKASINDAGELRFNNAYRLVIARA